jgi:uncharacterized protein YndB with AHSA1/START domain
MTKGAMETTIDRATNTITFQRRFAAKPEDLFDAWTRPEEVSEWWDPTGARLSACEIDRRPGGAFKFVTRDSAHSPPFSGVYRLVEPPSQLQFEAMGAVGTVTLASERGGTHMTVTICCGSAEHLEMFLKLGVDVGTDRTFDNLVVYVAKQAA